MVVRGAGADAGALTLTGAQRQQLERVRRVAAVLETCMMRLDELILIFGDF